MSLPPPRILGVIGTSGQNSATHVVMRELGARLQARGCTVDIFDPHAEPLPLFNPQLSHASPEFRALKTRVDQADVLILGTPDYHGSVSSTLKNFLDHFWAEYAGRLFVPVVVSHEKGLTVMDQIRTVARQCYAWSLPYGLSVRADSDVKNGQLTADGLEARLDMMVADVVVYGTLLAHQRRADLAGTNPGFLARYRPKPPATA